MTRTVFVNAASGPASAPGRDDVAKALPGWELVEVDEPKRLGDLVRRTLDAGASAIGVAGGDGTVRCVAEVLARTPVPLLVIPAGTRNHFARELGNDDIEAVADVARAGSERKVSVGRVNGRLFLNNASIGLYPELVRRRKRQETYRSKTVANIVAAVELARHGRPVEVEVEGDRVAAWLVFVGNGCYGDGFTDLIERDSLDSGVLDVRVVRADRRFARARVVASLAVGRVRRSQLVITRQTSALTINVPRQSVDLALDGEVVTFEAPLRFEVDASALTVLAPHEGGRRALK